MIAVTVGCLSLASLGYELLVTRLFSISQWSHLSFIAVGVAMFGYAAGGTLHSLLAGRLPGFAPGPAPVSRAAGPAIRTASRPAPGPGRKGQAALFGALSCAASMSIPASFAAARFLPLDYLRFPLEPVQALYLLLTWLVLSLPFLAAGLATSAAYAAEPQASGRIAGASLLGSSLGALAPAVLLPVLEEGGTVAAFAALALAPLAAPVFGARVRGTALGLLACAAALAAWRPEALAADPSSYKTLPQLLQAPGAAVVERSSRLRGRLEEVRSPSLRFAPGLSLSFEGGLPRQQGLVLDGEAAVVLYDPAGAPGLTFSRWTHSYAPWYLAGRGGRAEPGAALILQQDGGLAAACALEASAAPVTLVAEDPRIARRQGAWYGGTSLTTARDSPRSFLARRGPGWSVVFIEDWGPSIPGMASLQVDALLTVDAFRACWRRLEPRGVLAVSRRLVLPPSDSPRIFAALALAMKEESVQRPPDHLAVIRSWDSCTLIASRAPLGPAECAALREFAERRGFDLDYLPGLRLEETNRFSRYQRPLFAEEYARIAGGAAGSAARDGASLLDTAPQGDDRPFPSRFVKWGRAGEFFRATGGRLHTLLLTGEIVAGAALVQAVVVSAALLLVTFLVRGRALLGAGGKPRLYVLAGCCGTGFMAAEMAALDALTVLFPSPGVALAVTLGALLAFSALGGLASSRIGRRLLGPSLLAAAGGIGLLWLLLPAATAALLPLAMPGRLAAAAGLLALPGFLIGVPFPAVMRTLPGDSAAAASAVHRARAWAVNGCASVAVSFGSALLAPWLGIRSLLVLASAAYLAGGAAAAWSFTRGGAPRPSARRSSRSGGIAGPARSAAR